MGFAPPPSPDLQPFSTQGPAYSDPLQTLAEMQHLRTQGMQQQVAGLGLQQARLKMDSQKALLDAFVQGKGDLDATYQHAVQSGKVLPEDLTTFQTHKIKTEADMAALDEKKRTMLGEDINNYLGAISGVKDQAGLDAANAAAQKRGLFTSGKFTPLTQYPEDPTHMEAYTNGLLGLNQILTRRKETTGIAKTEAETAESIAKKGQAEAATAKSNLEQQLTKHKLDLYDTLIKTPQALDSRVDASIDPQKYPFLNARAKNEAKQQADLEGINKVIESYGRLASEQEKTIATETDPAVRQARVQQAVSTAQAVAPIETARSVATAVATEKAKAALSPDVFNRIVDPTSRNRAIMETEKYTKEYITKVNDAQKMLDTIDAAQGGNQAASGLIPLEEIRSIVNRVNRQELESVSGGGSLVRRVENMLSQATSGRMSGAQLKDLRALGNLQKEGASRAYQGSRLGTKTVYGVTPPEVDLTGIITPARGTPAVPVNPNPSGYVPGHVYGGMTYLGGDPNKRASWK